MDVVPEKTLRLLGTSGKGGGTPISRTYIFR